MTAPDSRRPAASGPRVREVPAVSRAIAILRLLGASRAPVGVKAIADALGMVPSTCLHILRVLVAEGLVKVDADTKRYTLGSGLLSLAHSVIERSGFATLAQPVLDQVARRRELTLMGVEIQDDSHMVVLAISRSATPFALRTDVGSRFPTLVSATGRLFAAFGGLPAGQLRKRFAALRWSAPMDFETWRGEVESARERGYAVDQDRYISGVTIVAVPLLDSAGRITHALVAAGISDQFDAAAITAVADEMRHEAGMISRQLLARG
jgi:DNA-binding IclR family transcriptional regulator